MAVTRRKMSVPAARVWDVVADASTYPRWVVGAQSVRFVEGRWPDVGARLHHKVGVWPLHIRDNTEVVEVSPPARLVMEGRVRPIGRARIALHITARGSGCEVEMAEYPISPAPLRTAAPLVEPLMALRNVETLRRLERCARERYAS